MTAHALHRSLLLLAGVALLSRAEAAGTSGGVYTPDSKHYGVNTITMPSVFYSVKVDARGVVTKLSGATITLKHEEGGIGCHKCWSAGVGFHTYSQMHAANASPENVAPNLCNFTQTFTTQYPLINKYYEATERGALLQICRNRPVGQNVVVAHHPLIDATWVTLAYGSGGQVIGGIGGDRIKYPPPDVSVTCEACPPITVQKRVVELRADEQQTFDVATLVQGGLPPISFTLSKVPTGMLQQGSVLTGRPVAGTYLSSITANGSCATGVSTVKDGVQFIVKYAPIVLASQTATPSALPKEGGAVKLEAKVTSAQLVVTAVRAKTVLGGKTSIVPLALASGTNKNGTWSAVWQVPANTAQDWLKYGILFEATDGDGKTTLITGNNLIEVKVAPLPAKPPAAPTPAPSNPVGPAPAKPPAPTTPPPQPVPPVVPKLPPS